MINTFRLGSIAMVAALHFWFMILEMLYWDKPLGRKTFRLDMDFAQKSKALAANQGLYNGFLAVGLIYSLTAQNQEVQRSFVFFFLGCVVVAGIFGAITVNKRIFFIQSGPALIALFLSIWGQ